MEGSGSEEGVHEPHEMAVDGEGALVKVTVAIGRKARETGEGLAAADSRTSL